MQLSVFISRIFFKTRLEGDSNKGVRSFTDRGKAMQGVS